MSPVERPRVYLAGPDVFRSDAEEHFAVMAAACETLGLEALSPFDASITASTPPHAIYEANMAMIRSAHGVVANLEAFRGAGPDSGTAFEVGAAVALGVKCQEVLSRHREARDRCCEIDAVMRAMPVVEVVPHRQGLAALV